MHDRIVRTTVTRLLLACALLPAPLLADQLLMKNGDVISGEIASIDDGKVNIKPAYADEFAVDLAEVAAIEADQPYEVVLDDGREVEALFEGGSDGQQKLLVEDQPRVLPIAEITLAEPPEPYYERISHIDLNMTWRDGNTDSKNNLLYADTRMRFGVHRHLFDLTVARDESDGVDTKKQDLFRYEYNWLLDGPWYLGGTAAFERDPIKDLDHRYTIGALLGRDIFKTDDRYLTVSLGAGWSEEEQANVTDSGGVGLWKLIYEHKFRDGSFAFFHNHTFDYQFYGNNNGIFKSNTGFRFDIISGVYTAISLRYDYETEPAEGQKSYDTTMAIGVGAEF